MENDDVVVVLCKFTTEGVGNPCTEETLPELVNIPGSLLRLDVIEPAINNRAESQEEPVLWDHLEAGILLLGWLLTSGL